MKTKKQLRGLGGHNGATHIRIIIADQRFRNKLHNAILHGSVLGAVLAIFGGICYIDTNMIAGGVISVAGMLWLGLFYVINAEDGIFGG